MSAIRGLVNPEDLQSSLLSLILAVPTRSRPWWNPPVGVLGSGRIFRGDSARQWYAGRMRLFLVGAILLIVFGIVASAEPTGLFLSTLALTWFMASFLSFLVDQLFGGYIAAAWTNRSQRQVVAVQPTVAAPTVAAPTVVQ